MPSICVTFLFTIFWMNNKQHAKLHGFEFNFTAFLGGGGGGLEKEKISICSAFREGG